MTKTTTLNRASTRWLATQRPVGDWAVDRFHAGRKQRWDLFDTKSEAVAAARIANAPADYATK